ncbi:hypothetical protein RI367_005083 [Sorochytrium milnesiophthora]
MLDICAVLPTELVLHVLSFLDHASLCRAGEVSRQWHAQAQDDALWRHLHMALHRQYPITSAGLHPLGCYNDDLQRLTEQDVLSIMQARVAAKYISDHDERVKQAIETQDGQALRAMLATTWADWLAPLSLRNVRTASKWKCSYAVNVMDAQRRYITQHELCSMDWKFHVLPMTLLPPESAENLWCAFDADGLYRTNLFNETLHLHWRFLGDDEEADVNVDLGLFQSDLLADIRDEYLASSPEERRNVRFRYRFIQVGSYPSLSVSRDADTWMWTLSNQYVSFESHLRPSESTLSVAA